MSTTGDSTSSCSEEDVLLPETNTLSDDRSNEPIMSAAANDDVAMTATAADLETSLATAVVHRHNENNGMDDDEDDERGGIDGDGDELQKHNEDAANNNGKNGNDDEHDDDGGDDATNATTPIDSKTNNNQSGEQPTTDNNAFGNGAGYFSLEALQKMAQFVSAAMTNNSDNEDAQKQLAVLQSTLFTLQHQQLFQMQLIQQLQSQLSINRTGKDDNNGNADDDDDQIGGDGGAGEEEDDDRTHVDENEREEGELTEEQMAEEQRKYEQEQKAIALEKEKLRAKQLEANAGKGENNQHGGAERGASELKGHVERNDTISAMEASFSSPFASTIITNHDEPSSMDGLNSLEMLQKRAEEVLDSASRGILSGSLTDEMSFKSDGKGRNEPFFKHRCRYCGKVFGSDSALQIHIRSHTGERPFKCNVCGSRFTTKGNLKVHFQRHTQKFPHIHMNPNPIPEHLDKFYPALLPPLPPGQQPPLSPPPQSQSQMPEPPETADASRLNRLIQPPPMNLPFPPIPGLPASLQALQALPGLPFLRPPFDLLKQMGAHPFFGAMREAASAHQAELEQDAPADLSKPADLTKPQIKKEPKENHIDEEDDEEEDDIENGSRSALNKTDDSDMCDEPKKKCVEKPAEKQPRRRSASPSPLPLPMRRSPPSWKDDKSECMSPARSLDNYSPKIDQPENLSSRLSSSKHSPSSVGSSRTVTNEANHFAENQNEIKMFPTLLPRPGSNDNSWESFIEVDKSSETSKLQQFVDNIESKITEPNECGVCHKVLSCHSALIMHYRTHTGIRPFKCLICGRKFTTKGNLKTHMSVHRMKPPMRTVHQCPVCHKKYSNSLVLQQHIRLHTGEPTDLTLEQISAAEIPTGISPNATTFPMGLNPFAFPGMAGLPPNAMGPESSNGDNDEFMDDEFDEESNYDQASNTGSVSGDSNQNISSRMTSDETHSRAISAMLAEHNKSVENLSRAPSAASHPDSVEEKRSSNPRTPQPLSPAPSDTSQGALDLTPTQTAQTDRKTRLGRFANAPIAANSVRENASSAFANFPFIPHVSTTSPMMTNALNSLAQSVAPMGPFNPMALTGKHTKFIYQNQFKNGIKQSNRF